ncbi:hypothetical protein Lal_00018881, partial [Lupinus albus]
NGREKATAERKKRRKKKRKKEGKKKKEERKRKEGRKEGKREKEVKEDITIALYIPQTLRGSLTNDDIFYIVRGHGFTAKC